MSLRFSLYLEIRSLAYSLAFARALLALYAFPVLCEFECLGRMTRIGSPCDRLAFRRSLLRLVAGLIGHQVWMPVTYAKSSYADCLARFWVLVIWRHWINW
jgi:hypothetical protein